MPLSTNQQLVAGFILLNYLDHLRRRHAQSSETQVDVLIVGFGLAGGSAAMQALQSAEQGKQKPNILIVDRFEGGGATSRSGGIIYMGGGTDVQNKLQVEDTPENMYAYLTQEIGGVVKPTTLWRFCASSKSCAAWLRDSFKMTFNVPNESAVLCPFKTSNAPDRYSLFYSGSETAAPFSDLARPAARGHKVVGPGNLVGTGNVLWEQLEHTVLRLEDEKRGVRVWAWHKVAELIMERGQVVGAKLCSMADAPLPIRWLYKLLAFVGSLTNPLNYLDNLILRLMLLLERLFGVEKIVKTAKGVILSAGGFGRNQELMAKYLSPYVGCMPIGSAGDDGSGIFELGIKQAHAASACLNNGSAWKFIVPAASMAKGILLSPRGERLINEDVYGARLAGSVLKTQCKGWLLLDATIVRECLDQVANSGGDMLLFQKTFTLMNIHWNRVKADSLEELASKTGMDLAVLKAQLDTYNADCAQKKDSRFGKKPHLLSPIVTAPFYAVNFSYVGTPFVTAYFSLGGLVVDENSGLVISQDTGQPIPGLYAAGRNACGIPSKSYVSGLSLADCIYSGRRAGMHVMTQQVFAQEFDRAEGEQQREGKQQGLGKL